MDRRTANLFLLLILAQAAHSVEEFAFRLYDRLAPARFVAETISADRQLGFAIGNIVIVLAGLLCWWAWVRPGRRGARGIAWFWALVEISNGVGHVLFAITAGGYFPVATAPLLLVLGGLLFRELRRSKVA